MARYRFKQWSDGNTLQERTLTNVQADINLSAEFQQIFRVTLNGVMNKGKVAVNNSPFTYSQSAELDAGTSCTLKAQPDTGYIFSQWSDGNTNQIRTITSLSDDITLSAEFTEDVHDVRLYVEDNIGGKVKIDDGTPGLQAYLQVLDGDSCQISAIPDSGYVFQRWSDGDTNATRTLSDITDDVTLEATFQLESSDVTVSLSVKNNTGGKVSIDSGTQGLTATKQINSGGDCTVQAHSDSGYIFKKWSDGNTDQIRSYFGLTSDVTLEAEFEAQTAHTVTLTVKDNTGGKVKIDDNPEDFMVTKTLQPGDSCVAHCIAQPGYIFKQWDDGSEEAARVISNLSGDVSYEAEFVADADHVMLTCVAQGGGLVQIDSDERGVVVSKVCDKYSTHTITAFAPSGFMFDRWDDGSTLQTRTIDNMSADITVVASFSPAITMQLTKDPGDTGSNALNWSLRKGFDVILEGVLFGTFACTQGETFNLRFIKPDDWPTSYKMCIYRDGVKVASALGTEMYVMSSETADTAHSYRITGEL